MLDPRRRLFVALDAPDAARATGIVDRLGDSVAAYKVGLELLFGGGLAFAEGLKAQGFDVFLDMKLLDIPNTVEKSAHNIAQMGFDYLTVHGTDRKTLDAAVKGRGSSRLKLLAVTVLTSLDAADLKQQGITGLSPAELVVHRAKLAKDAGFDGVIASGEEATAVRAAVGPDFHIVTPGIRLKAGADGDQARVVTPGSAITERRVAPRCRPTDNRGPRAEGRGAPDRRNDQAGHCVSLYKSFFTVGGLTLLSRILGFARDVAFAALLGAGPIAEAFVVAFRFPNLFRRWFGEGAFNAAFVPLFAKRLEGEGRDEARRFAEEAMAGLAFLLIALSAAAMLAMPWLMYGLAPGFAETPEKFDLAVVMSRIAFPYLFCMSIVALMSGVLNSFGKFAESSAISIVLNVTLMAAMGIAWLLGYGNDPRTGIVLAWGIFAAGVLQVLLLLDGLRRAKFILRLRRPRITDGVRQLIKLGVPGIIAGGVTQINIVIGGMIASLQAGAVSHLFYADRLYELPLAIVGIAIGVVLLPSISKFLRAGNDAGAQDAQNRSLEFALLLTVPAAVALAVIPNEIVSALYQRGAFSAADTRAVAAALIFFAIGLPSFVMIKVFSPAYFAREDTKTPMRFAAISLTVNTVGSVALFFLFRQLGWMPHVGIAVATAIGGWLNALLLWGTLKARGHFVADARLKRTRAADPDFERADGGGALAGATDCGAVAGPRAVRALAARRGAGLGDVRRHGLFLGCVRNGCAQRPAA